MPKQTAKLENWRLDHGRLVGNVSGHPRFEDGELVTTSPVMSPPDSIKEGAQVTTKNTIYTLGKEANNG